MPLGTISGLGVGSNLDLQGTLEKLRQIDDVAVTSLENKKTTANNRLSAFDAVNAALLGVKTHALDLSLESNFLTKQISGLDDSVASATVALGTADTTYSLEVTRLATRSSFQSSGVATADTVITTTDTTFEYKLGASGQTISVPVSANTTLTQLAELINNAPDNPGITATVTDTGIGETPFSLVLTADTTGEDNRISVVTPLANLSFTELQGAAGASLNAALKVNGVTYERQSNTGITDVVQGVTLNLQDTGSTSFQITSDTSATEESIKSLITTFQAAIQEINNNTAYDSETGTFALLASSGALRGASQELNALLSTRINTGGTLTSLVDLGLTFNEDGTITLDEDVLSTALAEHPEDVRTLFAGQTGVTGLGTLLTDKLTELTQSTGLIATEKQATQTQISRLDDSIASTKARLDRRYDTLAQQFAALDVYAARLQQQGDFLTDFISSLDSASQS